MPSTFPSTPDDLGRSDLTHGDVTDALTAVESAVLELLRRGGDLLTGIVAPVDALDNPPTSGTWTWSNQSSAWFSPAYEVSWQAGDNTGVVPYIEGLGSGAVQPSVLVGAGPFASDQPAPGIPQYDWNSNNPDGFVTTATSAGSGIVFLITEEEGFPATPTAPPRPDLNVLDYLGDLVLTNGTTPVPWARDEGTGRDGDLYLRTDTKQLYPARTDGHWHTPIALNDPVKELNVSAAADVPVLTGYGYYGGTTDLIYLESGAIPDGSGGFLSGPVFRITQTGEVHAGGGVVLKSPNGTAYRLTVADDGSLSTEPA